MKTISYKANPGNTITGTFTVLGKFHHKVHMENRFEEVTDVLDDCIPEPMPGSSVSLSDSLHPDNDSSILEI
ncbi:hypothetical protein HUJ05_001007 [Dendroctonus ponderosae]|nr:hypothetical protein HUJ05_001007 [Dendroctonus ponderosae]